MFARLPMSALRMVAPTACAMALTLVSTGVSDGAAKAAQVMVTGDITSQPIGHYQFCKVNATECSIHPADRGPAKLTPQLWKKVVAVNARVNRSVQPVNDIDLYGQDEVWTYPDKAGDCEDYVLLKRRLLARAGISLSNLLITVVRKPDGEGHAVLTVRTDRGDYILDNLTDAVRGFEDTGYRFLKRQSTTDTGRWVSIRAGSSSLVGSVD
jgi:predicted transglutaminase-like cysteine proteinase